jgi:hypothetical protein
MDSEEEAKPTLQHYRLLRKALRIERTVRTPRTGEEMTA